MKTIVTHNGSFHADDIFSVAILLKVYPDAQVIRTRDQEVIEQGDIVVDVGGEYDSSRNRYDHHQQGGAGERKNGIPYASFGLVWKQYGDQVAGTKETADFVDQKYIQAIDAYDTGYDLVSNIHPDIDVLTVDDLFSLFLPTWKEEQLTPDEQFLPLVEIAGKILDRCIAKAHAGLEGELCVNEIYQNTHDKRIIQLDKRYPWKSFLISKEEPLFVIFSIEDGKWGIQAVPEKLGTFKNKKEFPAKWAGLRDEELEQASGVPGAKFCHTKLFFVVATTREAAVQLATFAIQE